jgi:hypothetical protein
MVDVRSDFWAHMKPNTKPNGVLATPTIEPPSAWATRSELWQSRVERASIRRTKRAKPQSALILAGHGVSLRIHGGRSKSKMV